jgi:transglutaminase-like putative cysteine protease
MDLAPFLAPSRFVESTHAAIVEHVAFLDLEALAPRARAARLFEHVRSDVRYDFLAKFGEDDYLASNVLASGRGFCVQKAVLLAALGRAAGIPTAIVLCDMRDHALPERIAQALRTDVMHHHGLNAFHLDGRWVSVDASLDPKFLDRKRLARVAFDGTADALLPKATLDGARAAEYLVFHGRYADLPFAETTQAFLDGYRNADFAALLGMGVNIAPSGG